MNLVTVQSPTLHARLVMHTVSLSLALHTLNAVVLMSPGLELFNIVQNCNCFLARRKMNF